MLNIVVKPYSVLNKQTKAVAILLPGNNLGVMKLPASFKNFIVSAGRKKFFKYKFGEVKFFPDTRGRLDWLILAATGPVKDLAVSKFDQLIKTIIHQAKKRDVVVLHLYVPETVAQKFGAEKIGELITVASLMADYECVRYKSRPEEEPKKKLVKIVLILADNKKVKLCAQGVKIGKIEGESVNLARDYGNLPANVMTPTILAQWAQAIAQETKQKLLVLKEKDMQRLGMGGILGVSKGSAEEAKFIILEHWAGNKKNQPIVLVGKGITFDSGGISIKPSQAMDEMKFDMSGGAAVLGVMRIIGLLKLPINVAGLVPASENVPSGTAYKPGDILTLGDKTTVEVLNTDAEGRIILADALIYARRYKPRVIIDVATLTGAIVVALGDATAGLFSNDQELTTDILAAALQSAEKFWPMPLPEEYTERMKSTLADLRNISSKPGGGAITAAKFLESFIERGVSWAHLDIAGTAWINAESETSAVGATGMSVKTLVNYLRQQIKV